MNPSRFGILTLTSGCASSTSLVSKASGRRISYGDIAKFADAPDELPNIIEADLTRPAQFKLIGRTDIGRVDIPSKVNGTARFGIDV